MTMSPEEKIAYNKKVRKTIKKLDSLFKRHIYKLSPKTVLYVIASVHKMCVMMKKETKRRMLQSTDKNYYRRLYDGFAKSEAKAIKVMKKIRNIMRAEALDQKRSNRRKSNHN